jgi:hypothetical protein
LLLEPQRTNINSYSEQFNNAYWEKTNSTITANATASPDGYTNADAWLETSASGEHRLYDNGISVTSGTAYTCSLFVKANGRSWVSIEFFAGGGGFNGNRVWFNISNGTIGTTQAGITAKIDNYGNGWYRIQATKTADTTTTGYILYHLATADGATSYAGDVTKGAFVYGGMTEVGSYATSYIPTLGASVTRVADAASKTGISSLIGQTEGTLFVEALLTHSTASNEYLIQVSVDADNRFFIYREGSTNKLGCFARVGASTIFNNVTASASTGTIKAAFAYKSGSFAFYVNGVQVAVSSSTYTTPASMGIFNLDSNAGAENGFYTYAQALLFKTRLTNAQLAELTA